MKDADEFENRLRQELEKGSDDLDPVIAARLQAARKTALAAADKPSFGGWRQHRPLIAGSVTAVLVLSVVIMAPWQQGNDETGLVAAMEDLELMSSKDGLEFYEQLEFYQWLDEQHAG